MDVRVDLKEFGSGQERHKELCRYLAAEISGLEVESVAPAGQDRRTPELPDAEPAAAGALDVACRPNQEQLAGLVTAVRDWLRRSPVQRIVRVTVDGDTVELTGGAGEPQRPDVQAWIGRHALG